MDQRRDATDVGGFDDTADMRSSGDLRVGNCMFCSGPCWARDGYPICYECVRAGRVSAL